MIEAEKVQSFKDPGGCVALRILLEDFEKNIKKLSFEKETQYKKMKQSFSNKIKMTILTQICYLWKKISRIKIYSHKKISFN